MPKPNPALGATLVTLGTLALFCASIIGPIVGVDANSAEDSKRYFPPLVEAIVVAALVGFPGAILVAFGRRLRNVEQASIQRFAGNLLIAIGIVWMFVTGACALPLSMTTARGTQLIDASLFVSGAIICIIGLALKRSEPK